MSKANRYDGTNGNGYQPIATEGSGVPVPPGPEDPTRETCGQAWSTAHQDAFNNALAAAGSDWYVWCVMGRLKVYNSDGDVVTWAPIDASVAALVMAENLAAAAFNRGMACGRKSLAADLRRTLGCAEAQTDDDQART